MVDPNCKIVEIFNERVVLFIFIIVIWQDNLLPPSQRCSYDCEKEPTGPLDRKRLIEHINKQAMETPDQPELKPYVAGTVRGKKVHFADLC